MPRQTQAGIFDLFDQARRVGDFLPLISFSQRYLAETDPHKRAIVVADVCEWAASKTENKIDDRYVGHFKAFLLSDAGEAFVRDLAADLEAITKPEAQ